MKIVQIMIITAGALIGGMWLLACNMASRTVSIKEWLRPLIVIITITIILVYLTGCVAWYGLGPNYPGLRDTCLP